MYTSLYKIWYDENIFDDIQKLDDKFLDNLRKYVNSLTKIKNKSDDKIAHLIIDEELKNISYMMENLFEIRINKILKSIQDEKNLKSSFLTNSERRFYETTRNLYQNCYDLFYSSSHGSKIKDFDNFFHQYVPIRILKDMTAIVGADLKTYGPFKAEDIIILPKKNAETLIKHNYAIAISVKREKIQKMI
ncbi:MAG: DNA replication complex subunit Gins51 [Candidatus Helarchaeota archaeon]